MLKKLPWFKSIIYVIAAYIFANIVQIIIDNNIISSYISMVIVYMCIFVIAAVSLNLVIGITGQFSLGHAGFMAMGAYFSAIVTKTGLLGLIDTSTLPALYQTQQDK